MYAMEFKHDNVTMQLNFLRVGCRVDLASQARCLQCRGKESLATIGFVEVANVGSTNQVGEQLITSVLAT